MTFPVDSSGAFGSGYTCPGCGNYVPPAISHACQGRIGVIPQSTMNIVFKPQLGEYAREVLNQTLRRTDDEIVGVEADIERDVQRLERQREFLRTLHERAAEIKELLDA